MPEKSAPSSAWASRRWRSSAAPRDAVPDREGDDRRLEARAEGSPRHLGGKLGARLQAAVVTLAVRNRVSRRDATELLRELFGARLASGSVEAIVSRAGEALAGPYAHLH